MRLIKRLVCLFIICIGPYNCFAFDISELADYQGIVIKTMVESDTLHKKTSKKTEIRNGAALRKILGDEKVKFKTQYVYIGKKQIEHLGTTTWYHYTPKSTNKKVYHLYYQKNDVMYEGNIGDTLVVGKKNDEEITLLILQKGHKDIAKVYEIAGINEMIDSEIAPKPSFWKRLFGRSDSRAEKLAKVEMAVELGESKVAPQKKSRSKKPTEPDMDLNPNSYEPINFEAQRNKYNKRIVLIGTPRIVDGDTIILEELFNIRVIGIDAPESKQMCLDGKGKEYSCGKKSKEHLEKLVGNGRVKCEIRGIGRFGRHTGLCYSMKDVNLNKTMVRDGYAVVSTYPPILFQNEENLAIKEKSGIWQGKFQHPHCFRHQKKQDWTVKGLCEDNKYYPGWEKLGIKSK